MRGLVRISLIVFAVLSAGTAVSAQMDPFNRERQREEDAKIVKEMLAKQQSEREKKELAKKEAEKEEKREGRGPPSKAAPPPGAKGPQHESLQGPARASARSGRGAAVNPIGFAVAAVLMARVASRQGRDEEEPSPLARFVAPTAAVLYGGCAVSTLVVGLPVLVVPPCI